MVHSRTNQRLCHLAVRIEHERLVVPGFGGLVRVRVRVRVGVRAGVRVGVSVGVWVRVGAYRYVRVHAYGYICSRTAMQAVIQLILE